MALQIEDVEIFARERPGRSRTAFESRRKWRRFNGDPEVSIRCKDTHLNEQAIGALAALLLRPVLEAIGLEDSKATLVLRASGGDKREPALMLRRPKDEGKFPCADLVVFVTND